MAGNTRHLSFAYSTAHHINTAADYATSLAASGFEPDDEMKARLRFDINRLYNAALILIGAGILQESACDGRQPDRRNRGVKSVVNPDPD